MEWEPGHSTQGASTKKICKIKMAMSNIHHHLMNTIQHQQKRGPNSKLKLLKNVCVLGHRWSLSLIHKYFVAGGIWISTECRYMLKTLLQAPLAVDNAFREALLREEALQRCGGTWGCVYEWGCGGRFLMLGRWLAAGVSYTSTRSRWHQTDWGDNKTHDLRL